MKKNYALLSGLILATTLGFAQDRVKFANEEAKIKLSEEVSSTNFVAAPKVRAQKAKAFGDTLFSETFANQVPAGWTVTNQAGNSNNWIWSNAAPGGQYSGNAGALNSTTGSDGFMALPADLYNTPFPVGGPVGMDVWFTSPAITIPSTGSVVLEWQQSSRYCCAATNELVAEVSIDNINWTAYDAMFGRNANTAVGDPTPELAAVNVSAQFANQTTVYVRFRSTANTHYYWLIDDVTLLEGPGDGLELEDYSINFSDTSLNPVHSMVPQLILEPLTFTGMIYNSGSNTLNAVGVEVEVFQDSTFYGGAGSGAGTVDIKTAMLGIPMPSGSRDTLTTPAYLNTGNGYYRALFSAVTSGANQTPALAVASQSFAVSDTVLAKELGPYVGDAGPGNYVGGGNDGDRWGSLMTIGRNANTASSVLATTLSILVANVTTNVGASIQPRVWYWDDTSSTIAGAITSPPVGSSPFSTIIDTSMLGTWISLPIFPPASLTPGAQYVVGWEQTGGASSGAEFTAARDRVLEPAQPDVTNFVYVNDAAPAWGWVSQLAAVRLNFGNFIIGVNEEAVKSEFSVSPNPSSGLITLNVSSSVTKTYALSVRNMIGQSVYTDNLSVSGSKSQDLDLSNIEKGVYFVTLENGNERMVKKVVIK